MEEPKINSDIIPQTPLWWRSKALEQFHSGKSLSRTTPVLCDSSSLVLSMAIFVSELNCLPLCFASTADDPSTSLTGNSMGTRSLERPLSMPFHKPIVSTSGPRITKPLARFVSFLGSGFDHF